MSDIEREKQIRERVEKATRGPWTMIGDKGKPYGLVPSGRPGTICTFKDLPTDEDHVLMSCAPVDLLWCLERIEGLRRRLELAGKLEELLDEMAAEYAQLSIDSYAQPRHKDVDEQMADWKRGDHAGYERHLDIQKALAAFRADGGAKP